MKISAIDITSMTRYERTGLMTLSLAVTMMLVAIVPLPITAPISVLYVLNFGGICMAIVITSTITQSELDDPHTPFANTAFANGVWRNTVLTTTSFAITLAMCQWSRASPSHLKTMAALALFGSMSKIYQHVRAARHQLALACQLWALLFWAFYALIVVAVLFLNAS